MKGVIATTCASALGATLLISPAVAAPAAPATPASSGLSAGEWTGTLSVNADATVDQLGRNTTIGTGVITATDGLEGVSGEWALEMKARLRFDPSTGMPDEWNNKVADVATSGYLRGSSSETLMEPQGVTISFPGIGAMDVSSEYQLTWLLQATNIGCTQVSGDFVSTTRAAAPSYGIDFTMLSGVYSMNKQDSVPVGQRETFNIRLTELNQQFMAMFSALAEGGDLAGLAVLLEDAETLGRERRADPACVSGGSIENLLASEVGLMLSRFVDRDIRGDAEGRLSAADWNRLTTAARRTGVFQSQPWVSGPERQRLAQVLSARISSEIARLGGTPAEVDEARIALMDLGLAATSAGLGIEANQAFSALRN